ncbi:MAG: hypothetical protein V3T77_09835, partial [Planctomycetota bacterium]
MPYQALWEKHRRFLMQVVGALALFLVLLSLASGYQNQAVEERREQRTEAERLQRAVEKLDIKYPREKEARKVLELRCRKLLGLISLHENQNRRPPAEGSIDPGIDFSKTFEEVWTQFTDRADKQNLSYPPQNEVSFGLGSDLTAADWSDRYCQLEVLERFLNAAVAHQVRSIETIIPREVENEPIADNDDLAMMRYPVQVKLVASYNTLLGLMESFQKDENFL